MIEKAIPNEKNEDHETIDSIVSNEMNKLNLKFYCKSVESVFIKVESSSKIIESGSIMISFLTLYFPM